MINEPKIGYYGSQVAAPAFRNIVKRIIGLPESADLALIEKDYLNIDQNPRNAEVSLSAAEAPNHETGAYQIMKVSQKVNNAKANHKTQAALADVTDNKAGLALPQFIGLTLREALETISQLNLTVEIEGSGVVVDQYPKAGTRQNPETKIKLVCEP